MTITRLFQICAWGALAAIGVLSLITPRLRPVTAAPHSLEHAAIFALAGLAVGLGYPHHAVRNMIVLTVFAGLIELAQLYAPGRHARLSDFLIDALAACAGVIAALAITKAITKALARTASRP